jgi:hypothetical protein
MDLSKVLEQLRKELEHLDVAILTLERLQTTAVRRGRPPKALAALREAAKLRPPAAASVPKRIRRGSQSG